MVMSAPHPCRVLLTRARFWRRGQAVYHAHGALLHATFDALLAESQVCRLLTGGLSPASVDPGCVCPCVWMGGCQAPGATQRDTLMLRGLKFAVFHALRAGLATAPVLGGGRPDAAALAAGRARVVALAQAVLASPFMSDKSFALGQLLELGGPEAVAAQARLGLCI